MDSKNNNFNKIEILKNIDDKTLMEEIQKQLNKRGLSEEMDEEENKRKKIKIDGIIIYILNLKIR